MVIYLNNSFYNKLILAVINLIAIVSLYLTEINLLIKLTIFIGFVVTSYCSFLEQNLIKALYITMVPYRSILLIKSKFISYNNYREVKVTFTKIVYFSKIIIILAFSNRLKNFYVLVFRTKVEEEIFKSLIILAKYNFLPVHSFL